MWLLLVAAFSAGACLAPQLCCPRGLHPQPEVPGPEPVCHSFLSQSSQFPALPTPEPSRSMLKPQPLLSSYHPSLQPLFLPKSAWVISAQVISSWCPRLPQTCCWAQSPWLQDKSLLVKSLRKEHPGVYWEQPLGHSHHVPCLKTVPGERDGCTIPNPGQGLFWQFVITYDRIPVPSSIPRSSLIKYYRSILWDEARCEMQHSKDAPKGEPLAVFP